MSRAVVPPAPTPAPPVPAPPARPVGQVGGRAGLRARARTTPGLLRLLSVALVVAIVALWTASFLSTLARRQAMHAMSGSAAPAFIAAQRLHAELSEADATVVGAFLAGETEPAGKRKAYRQSVSAATAQLDVLARAGASADAQRALLVVSAQLPVYTGLVDQARADNRLGLNVVGAYLRQASELMRDTILPAADTLAALEADQIDDGYRRATSSVHPVLVTVAGVVTLAGLVGVQLLLHRRTRRLLNLPLVAATAIVAVIVGLTLAAFATERARLVDGRDNGFVPMADVARARVLGLRAYGDQGLSLIARGDGAALDADADAVIGQLGYDPKTGRPTGSGVLAAVTALGGADHDDRASIDLAWRAYLAQSIRVRALVADPGGFQPAVALTLGDGAHDFTLFDTRADGALSNSQKLFAARLSSAAHGFDGLAIGLSAAAALAAALVLAGLQVRINEYR